METNEEHYNRLAVDYDAEAKSNDWAPNDILRSALKTLGVNHGRFLDIGAGTGLTTEVLNEFGPSSLICVEPSHGMRRLGRERELKAAWVGMTGEDYMSKAMPESFELITAIGVLEFVRKPELFIRASAVVLATNGLLMIAFEAIDEASESLTESGHYRQPLRVKDVEVILGDAGLSICYSKMFSGYVRSGRCISYVLLGAKKVNKT